MSDPNYVVEFTDGSKMTADMATKKDDVYQIRLGKEKIPVEIDKVKAFYEISHTDWGPTGVGEIHTENGNVYEVPFEKYGIAQELLR